MSVDRDLPVAHGLEQRALRAGRRAIDLVGQHDVAEDRSASVDKLAGLRIEHIAADDVAGQQVGRELDPRRSRPRRSWPGPCRSAFCRRRARPPTDVAVRLAKCCRPVPGDEIVGYVSLGRGITIHREDCRNVKTLKKAPERFVSVDWGGDNEASYRVELQVDAWDRTRLLEDLRGHSPRPGSTSSRRAARPNTRWSRTASS